MGAHILYQMQEWGGKVAPVFDADKAYKFLTYLSKKLNGTDLIWIFRW